MSLTPQVLATLKRLSELHPKLIDLSLDRIKRLLEILGNPQDFLPPTIHVAGTNGKGSTIAFLRTILEKSGYKVHVYSSPHLVRFNERIYLAGSEIEDKILIRFLNIVEKANANLPITFFEITTAAAFVAFATVPADILIIETGLGGRLDTTNVIKYPVLTVLTPISLDHQKFLGHHLAEISREKAGIIKAGRPCILAQQHPEAIHPIIARAQDVGAPLYSENEDWFLERKNNCFIYHGAKSKLELPLPNLLGYHQVSNCGLAIATLDRLNNFKIPNQNIKEGVKSTTWPARLQNLTKTLLNSELSTNWELWLDGGHNPAAGEAIASFIENNWSDKRLYLISGMMNSKDCKAYFQPIASLIETLYTVKIPGESQSMPAKQLADVGSQLNIKSTPFSSVKRAIEHIKKSNKKTGRILICGSLYLAGYILRIEEQKSVSKKLCTSIRQKLN